MKNNDVLRTVLDELGTAGATIVSLDQPRHIKIQYEHNGAVGTTTVATTPSDWRAPLNARAQIRKALRASALVAEPVTQVAASESGERASDGDRLRQAPHPTRLRNGTVCRKVRHRNLGQSRQ